MATSSNSSATLLLVTGLFSVGMVAIGYYYLQMNSKKPRTLTNDSIEAGVHNSQKTPTASIVTEEEKTGSIKSTATDIQTRDNGTFSRMTSKTTAASVSETIGKTVAIEMPMLPPASPKKPPESPTTTVKKVVEPPMKVVEPPVVAEASKELTSSPEKTPKSSPRKVAGNLKKEKESPVLVLSKKLNTSPKKAPETPNKVVEGHKQTIESPKEVVDQTKTATIEHPKQAPGSLVETPESVTKKIVGLEKAIEFAPAPEEVKPVTRKVSEDFIVAQAIAETASMFTDKILQEMLDHIALEQEYVQVELTQSMTLSQSTPELTNIEDAGIRSEDVAQTSAATEDEESIVEEKQKQEQEEEHVQDSSEQIQLASAEPIVDTAATTETLNSLKSSYTTLESWEAITLSPETNAASAQKTTTPLSLDAPAESHDESATPLSIDVPAENNEASAEDKSASSLVDSGGSTPGKRNRNRSKKSKSKKKKGKKH